MSIVRLSAFVCLVLALMLAPAAFAQGPTPTPTSVGDDVPGFSQGAAAQQGQPTAIPLPGADDPSAAPGAGITGPGGNGPRALLPILVSGQPARGTVGPDILGRWYTFNASAGDLVTITTSIPEGASLDTYLVLMGSFGQVWTHNDDSDGLLAGITDFQIPADDTYLVLMTTFSVMAIQSPPTTPTDYTITMTGATPPATMGPNELRVGGNRPPANETITLNNSNSEPVYYLFVDTPGGQVVDIRMESNDFDPLLWLLDPQGHILAVNDNAAPDGNTTALLDDVSLLQDGLHIVFATVNRFQFARSNPAENNPAYQEGRTSFSFTLTEVSSTVPAGDAQPQPGTGVQPGASPTPTPTASGGLQPGTGVQPGNSGGTVATPPVDDK
ncbi:MAG: hypothetical protein ACLFTK_09240 [Anaerolineales bacterium]